MKMFFTSVLILNLLLEALAAASLIGGPQGLANIQPETGMWAMNYGFAVIAIASAVFWIWPHRENRQAVTPVLGILLTFHTCLFIALSSAGTQVFGIVAHGIMTVLCLVLFTQRSKWCTS